MPVPATVAMIAERPSDATDAAVLRVSDKDIGQATLWRVAVCGGISGGGVQATGVRG